MYTTSRATQYCEHRAHFPHPTPPPRGAILQFAQGRQNPVLGCTPGVCHPGYATGADVLETYTVSQLLSGSEIKKSS